MTVSKIWQHGFAAVVLLLLVSQVQSAPGYHPGSYYSAHVIRDGGELTRNENTDSGYRWEDFKVLRIKGSRIPAKVGHGLEVFADVYGMPVGQQVTLTVTRPVRTAAGEPGSRTYTRNQPLYETLDIKCHVFGLKSELYL